MRIDTAKLKLDLVTNLPKSESKSKSSKSGIKSGLESKSVLEYCKSVFTLRRKICQVIYYAATMSCLDFLKYFVKRKVFRGCCVRI